MVKTGFYFTLCAKLAMPNIEPMTPNMVLTVASGASLTRTVSLELIAKRPALNNPSDEVRSMTNTERALLGPLMSLLTAASGYSRRIKIPLGFARLSEIPPIKDMASRYPLRLRDSYQAKGPVIEGNVTIGGGVVLCPNVRIGKGSFIAAGSVVTKDVPENSLVKGNPGRVSALPEKLQEQNMALSWRKFQDPKTGKLQ